MSGRTRTITLMVTARTPSHCTSTELADALGRILHGGAAAITTARFDRAVETKS